jgi:hypothetical protein
VEYKRGVVMGFKERLQNTVLEVAVADDGMSTAEYAIGTIAAAAFGAVLYTVVTGDSVVGALTALVQRALSPTI